MVHFCFILFPLIMQLYGFTYFCIYIQVIMYALKQNMLGYLFFMPSINLGILFISVLCYLPYFYMALEVNLLTSLQSRSKKFPLKHFISPITF